MISILWSGLLIGWTVSEIAIAVATRTSKSGGKVLDRGSQLILWIVILSSVTVCEWLREILLRIFWVAFTGYEL